MPFPHSFLSTRALSCFRNRALSPAAAKNRDAHLLFRDTPIPRCSLGRASLGEETEQRGG